MSTGSEAVARIPSCECDNCHGFMVLVAAIPPVDDLPEVRGFVCLTCGSRHVEEVEDGIGERSRSADVAAPGDMRSQRRHLARHGCVLYTPDGERIAACTLRNISQTGAQIELTDQVELPETLVLAFSFREEVRRTCELVWRFSVMAGMRFIAVG